MSAPTILLVEDDARMRHLLTNVLAQAGYQVTPSADGSHAIKLLTVQDGPAAPYAVVISDIRLGDVDGLQVLAHARRGPQPPAVILITGYGTLETAITALRAGAFDYLIKPFNPSDLLACVSRAIKHQEQQMSQAEAIRAITTVVDQLRAITPSIQSVEPAPEPVPQSTERLVQIGDLVIDRFRHVATFMNEPLRLTPIEYALLLCLGEMQGRVIPYSEIVRRTHNYIVEDFEAQSMLKVHIHNLRQKINPAYLVNIRGTGYMLAEP